MLSMSDILTEERKFQRNPVEERDLIKGVMPFDFAQGDDADNDYSYLLI